MECLMPWGGCALIEPHYPKACNGRPPVGLERMLRMYCIASWFNLSDVACEDALYDVPVFREFCRIDLGRERVPDATTLMNFRHLLETHQLGAAHHFGSALSCRSMICRLVRRFPQISAPHNTAHRAIRTIFARSCRRAGPVSVIFTTDKNRESARFQQSPQDHVITP